LHPCAKLGYLQYAAGGTPAPPGSVDQAPIGAAAGGIRVIASESKVSRNYAILNILFFKIRHPMALQEQIVEYRDGATLLQGFFCHDVARPGPLPAVIIAPTARGRDEFCAQKARRLAWQGYAAFVLDMYGQGRNVIAAAEARALMAPLMQDRQALARRMDAAVSTVKALPQVDARRVAAMGYCFGGLCVLDLARSGADVRGVASFHGMLTPNGLAAKKITAAILVLHGREDRLAPVQDVVAAEQEFTAAGADWQIHVYGHAKHAFTNREATDATSDFLYEEKADRRSWKTLQNFLGEVLR
jgi:dienelactone hydrolase